MSGVDAHLCKLRNTSAARYCTDRCRHSSLRINKSARLPSWMLPWLTGQFYPRVTAVRTHVVLIQQNIIPLLLVTAFTTTYCCMCMYANISFLFIEKKMKSVSRIRPMGGRLKLNFDTSGTISLGVHVPMVGFIKI